MKADKYKLRTNAKLGSVCIATLPTCRALQAFFRRVKRGETPGYPRFPLGVALCCSHCGLVINRDHNAALNIQESAYTLRAMASGLGEAAPPAAWQFEIAFCFCYHFGALAPLGFLAGELSQ